MDSLLRGCFEIKAAGENSLCWRLHSPYVKGVEVSDPNWQGARVDADVWDARIVNCR